MTRCARLCLLLLTLSLGFALVSAEAAELAYEIALDTDHNASTGCLTDLGGLESPDAQPGFDARLDVQIDFNFSPPRVGTVELIPCVSGAWAEAESELISEGGWNTGVDAGQLGGDSIELFVPLADLDLPNQLRLALRSTSASGEADVIDSQASVPIVLDLSTAVPALDRYAALLLTAMLLWLGFRARNQPAARVMVLVLAMAFAAQVVYAAALLWDGDISDWDTIPALASDPVNDVDDAAADLVNFFAQGSGGMLIFRTDLRNLEAPACAFSDGSTPNTSACGCGSTLCTANDTCDGSTNTCGSVCSGVPGGDTCATDFPSGDIGSGSHPCNAASCQGCPESCANELACDVVVFQHCATYPSDPGCYTDGVLVVAVENACYDGCGGNLCATSSFPSGDIASGSHPCNEVGCHGCPDSCANGLACGAAVNAHCAAYPTDPGCQLNGALCIGVIPE